jgi:hypothetical protein
MMITLEGISFKVVKRPLHQKKYLREIAWCGNAQSVATESITLLHFEIEILFWLLSEDTENTEVLELYVIPNVCSEYSEQN